MSKSRIQFYVDEETKRHVELAAARFDISVTEYCRHAIRQRLVDDDILHQASIETPVQPLDEDFWVELNEIHKEILRERDGRPIDVTQALEATRTERDDELLGLC